MESEDLLPYRCIHGAFYALPRKPLELKRKNPARTRYSNKKIFPSFCLAHTFYETRSDARRKNEKTGTQTNGQKRIQEWQACN